MSNTTRFTRNLIVLLFIISALLLLSVTIVQAQNQEQLLPEPVGIRPDAPAYALHGSYWVGAMTDEGETDYHSTKIQMWYPALNPDGLAEEISYEFDYRPDGMVMPVFGHAIADAAINVDGGPYPLVILATGHGGPRMFVGYLGEHLASHGFVVLSMDFEDNPFTAMEVPWHRSLITRPADITWLLDRAEAMTADDGMLAGMIDMENVGIVGYSLGGYTALVTAGARLDVNYFRETMADNPVCSGGDCNLVIDFESEMAELAGLDAVPEGLYPSWADPRIDAVVTIASGMGNYFSAESLADMDVPVLMIAGTADPITDVSTMNIYQNLPEVDKQLVLFEGATHTAWFLSCDEVPWMAQGAFGLCAEPVWDKDRTHDLANHFIGAFMMNIFYDDADAMLTPDAVNFPGIRYERVDV